MARCSVGDADQYATVTSRLVLAPKVLASRD